MPHPKPLTDSVVKTTRPGKSQRGWRDITDGGCRGLALRVSPRGEKVWQVRVKVAGRRIAEKIGVYPEVSLSEARRRAETLRAAAADGLTPTVHAQRRNTDTMTVRVAHAAYIDTKTGDLRPRTIAQKLHLFRCHIEPRIGDLLLRRVGKADVHRVVDAVRKTGAKVQPNRVASEIKALLNWAEERDYIDAVPALKKLKTRETPRQRTLTGDELREVWRASYEIGDVSGRYIRLVMLTAQRRDEVRLMTWDEIDLAQRLWTIPAARYKTGIPQVVPLSDAAIVELEAAGPRPSGFVLRGSKREAAFNGVQSALRRLRVRTGGRGDFTLHDMRRTCRTWMSREGVVFETAERVLGHVPRGMERVYDQHDRLAERRAALERWGQYLMALEDDAEAVSNVVALAAHRDA